MIKVAIVKIAIFNHKPKITLTLYFGEIKVVWSENPPLNPLCMTNVGPT
jgi:hypothetical protein